MPIMSQNARRNGTRWAHRLKGNHGNELPQNCLYLDTETQPTPHETVEGGTFNDLWFGYAVYTRREKHQAFSKGEWLRFTSPDELWDFVEAKTYQKKALYCYCANWNFDGLVLKAVDSLIARGYKIQRVIIEQMLFSMRFRKDGKTIVLMDVMNYYKQSVKALGEWLKYPKLDMPSEGSTQEQFNQYCIRDVNVIRRAMETLFDYVKLHDLGCMATTLASQSFNAYRHRFMPVPIFLSDNEGELKHARASFAGGVAILGRWGRAAERVYMLDINSLYPYCMKHYSMPSKLLSSFRNRPLSYLRRALDNYCVIADVQLDVTHERYPLHYGNRLTFPRGRFRTVLSTPELKRAFLEGDIVDYYQAYVYQADDLFSEYVDFFYGQRLEAKRTGDSVMAQQSKLMLNSLFGKWAQKGIRYEKIGTTEDNTVGVDEIYNIDTGKIRQIRYLPGIIEEKSSTVESFNSSPSIASHISSAGRDILWSLIYKAGQENFYYGDTDSLMVNERGYQRLSKYIDPDRLGYLKLQWESDDVEIHGLKDYRFGSERRIKGIRANAIQINANTYVQDKFISMKGAIRNGSVSRQEIVPVTKHLSREYHKGYLNSDGSVSPYVMDTTAESERMIEIRRLWALQTNHPL